MYYTIYNNILYLYNMTINALNLNYRIDVEENGMVVLFFWGWKGLCFYFGGEAHLSVNTGVKRSVLTPLPERLTARSSQRSAPVEEDNSRGGTTATHAHRYSSLGFLGFHRVLSHKFTGGAPGLDRMRTCGVWTRRGRLKQSRRGGRAVRSMAAGDGALPATVAASRSVEKALEEAAASGALNLATRKLKEFPRSARNYDLSDITHAGRSFPFSRPLRSPLQLPPERCQWAGCCAYCCSTTCFFLPRLPPPPTRSARTPPPATFIFSWLLSFMKHISYTEVDSGCCTPWVRRGQFEIIKAQFSRIKVIKGEQN